VPIQVLAKGFVDEPFYDEKLVEVLEMKAGL
jgi:hypothetical protein